MIRQARAGLLTLVQLLRAVTWGKQGSERLSSPIRVLGMWWGGRTEPVRRTHAGPANYVTSSEEHTLHMRCVLWTLLCEVWWLSKVPLSRDKALHCLPSGAVNGAGGMSVYYWCLCSSPSVPLFCPH